MPDQLSITCKSFAQLTTFELYEILHLRHIVFSIEQKCLYIDTDGFDQQAYHLMLRERDILVAYSRLFDVSMPYPGFLSIGRVVTHPEHRNKQYGKHLIQTSILKIRELFGELPIKIGAQAYLTGFYTSFGFKDIGQYYLEDGIPHLKMVME
ncbi:MAG: GNAT family N-acetyltransferase [Saprospiraceae bacterium]